LSPAASEKQTPPLSKVFFFFFPLFRHASQTLSQGKHKVSPLPITGPLPVLPPPPFSHSKKSARPCLNVSFVCPLPHMGMFLLPSSALYCWPLSSFPLENSRVLYHWPRGLPVFFSEYSPPFDRKSSRFSEIRKLHSSWVPRCDIFFFSGA